MEVIEDIRKLPALGGDAIHIWGVHVPDVLDRLEALHAVLCKKEQEKAARFHRDVDRQSSIAARGALRILLGGYLGIQPEQIAFEYSENGKPLLVSPAARRLPSAQHGRRAACGTPPIGDAVSFNVSHSDDWVVLAFGRNRAVGVDIEKIRPRMDVASIATRYFTADEVQQIETSADKTAAFFQLWVGKEAYVKASGSALFHELSAFSVPAADGEKDGWHFYRLNAGSKYASAVVSDQPATHIPCFDFAPLKW